MDRWIAASVSLSYKAVARSRDEVVRQPALGYKTGPPIGHFLYPSAAGGSVAELDAAINDAAALSDCE